MLERPYFTIRICSYNFCSTFDGTSFEKEIQGAVIFRRQDTCRVKNVFQTFLLYQTRWEVALKYVFHFEYKKQSSEHANRNFFGQFL